MAIAAGLDTGGRTGSAYLGKLLAEYAVHRPACDAPARKLPLTPTTRRVRARANQFTVLGQSQAILAYHLGGRHVMAMIPAQIRTQICGHDLVRLHGMLRLRTHGLASLNARNSSRNRPADRTHGTRSSCPLRARRAC